jgi:hypothetical protein
MRIVLLATLLIGAGLLHATQTASPAAFQSGKLTTVQMLGVKRADLAVAPAPVEGQAADGLIFHFLVARKDPSAPLALKETRDFFIGDESYRARTHRELGKTFVPSTTVNDAAKFFETHPSLAVGVEKTSGLSVITIEIRGANLSGGKLARIPLHVGTGRSVDSYSFETAIPSR